MLNGLSFPDNPPWLVQPVFAMTLYSSETLDSAAADYANGMQAMLAPVLERFHWYKDGEMTQFAPLPPGEVLRSLEVLRSGALNDLPLFGLTLHAGNNQQELAPPYFTCQFDQTEPSRTDAFLHVALDPSIVAKEPDRTVEWARAVVSQCPVTSGAAGYSLLWETADPRVPRRAGAFLRGAHRRHAGLLSSEPFTLSSHARNLIVEVGWLTFVNESVVKNVEMTVLADTGGISVERLTKDKVMIRAGREPRLGDVNRREELPDYTQVANALENGFISEMEAATVNSLVFDEDEVVSWVRRFVTEAQ